jgi:hypothetical protein
MAPKKAAKKRAPPKPKPLFKPLTRYNDKTAYERMAVIRQQNVEHHSSFVATQNLRRNIIRHQENANYQNEIDKLKAATVQGGLHAAALARLDHLENMVIR